MSYDRVDWHYGGEYPADLPPENGGTHIGMFLAWAIMNNLEGELLKEELAEALAAVRARLITGRQFLIEQCDEKFLEESLSDEGNEFARIYYEDGAYIADYAHVLAAELPSLYHVADTWENYDKIAQVISDHYAEWKAYLSQGGEHDLN